MSVDISQVFEISQAPTDDNLRKLIDEPINEDLIGKNKYANNAEYIPDNVYKRILNKLTNYKWSFVPHTWEEKEGYIQYIGLLIVPGYGVHTGVGSAKANKKDNSNTLSAAKTYAFKNACKEMGLAPNVGDEDFDEELFENDVEEVINEKAKEVEDSKKKKKKKKPSDDKKKKKPNFKKRVDELREAYELEEDDDLVAFLQIWNEEIVELDDMEEEDWAEFFKYFDKNKKLFEEF